MVGHHYHLVKEVVMGGTTADIPLATQSKAGLMSAEDKVKLDNLVVLILTQEEYDALEVKAENTIYFIKS